MNTIPPSVFHLGQKIICINDSFPRAVLDWCVSFPVAGYVYTIRAIQVGPSNVGFLLNEVVNPKSSLGFEAGFATTRFVPWLGACSEAGQVDAVTKLNE
jgi:hypothetical protein